jgi:hypothetical protein
MGVDILSAQQEFLEKFLPYSNRKQESDRRPDRIASANPIPKSEYAITPAGALRETSIYGECN